jgi:hypothetical protein
MNPRRLGRVMAAAVLIATVLTAFMPPGLCACWLNPAVETAHVHIGRPPVDHSHDYLSNSADAVGPIGLVISPPSLNSLTLVALAGVIWTRSTGPRAEGKSWIVLPASPPPKVSHS